MSIVYFSTQIQDNTRADIQIFRTSKKVKQVTKCNLKIRAFPNILMNYCETHQEKNIADSQWEKTTRCIGISLTKNTQYLYAKNSKILLEDKKLSL